MGVSGSALSRRTTSGLAIRTRTASPAWYSHGRSYSTMKRDASENVPVSPPPTKRKLESTTTNKAVANFFAPISKKSAESIQWSTIHETLLKGHYKHRSDATSPRRQKIAAFDFVRDANPCPTRNVLTDEDSTLITTSSGNVFGKDAKDWRWLYGNVVSKLRGLYQDGYRVVILSNQGGFKLFDDKKLSKKDTDRLCNFKEKVGYVINQLDIPISIYAATAKDNFRKPRIGMWEELRDDYDLDETAQPDREHSFFVGDAAGRLAIKGFKADHSSSDRNFAANLGISFKTPEEFFQAKEPREWKRAFDPEEFRKHESDNSAVFSRTSTLDIVLFCGSPGAGKSTFYHTHLLPLGYERVNQDTLKTREKCLQAASEHLSKGRPVVIDNTNADPQTRVHWIELARRLNLPIRCLLFTASADLCRHNDTVRALHSGHAELNPERREMLPFMAFTGFKSRYREPTLAEGFADIVQVDFKFRGEAELWNVWSKYWA